MSSKVDSEYKDIAVEITGNIKNNPSSNHFQQLQISKIEHSILDFPKNFGAKLRNKQPIEINSIKRNSDPQIVYPNSDLRFHYQYFKSHKNVFCEYFQPSFFVDEPPSIEFGLFNINFCPYCSREFWQNIGVDI